MAWETPKTNWSGKRDANGVYVGDHFNATDFNRIKNNLQYLRDMAIALYDEFDIVSLGADRTPADYFYADEINQLEVNFTIINSNTFKRSYGNAPAFVENGNTMTFADLNRLEGAILDLYDKLQNVVYGRRMFTMNFGMKGGSL